MKQILIACFVTLSCNAQNEKMQTIGSAKNYLLTCPCKLFKYYEQGNMFYFCEDKNNNIEYLIKEFKHKDKLDIIFSTIEKSIKKQEDSELDSIVNNKTHHAINNYLKHNPNGRVIDVMGTKSVIVENKEENKLFFSDTDYIASHEIIVSGNDSTLVNMFFKKTVNSLTQKQNNIKNIF